MTSPQTRIAGSTALTAAAQVVTMGIGGVLAIIIGLKFGADAETDGVFAAYGVYGLALLVAQSVRTTVVARLVEGEGVEANLDPYIGAVLIVLVGLAVPLVVLGAPVADLLTGNLGDEARDAARTALAIFWLAAAGQLVAGICSAALGANGDFRTPAVAYVVGGVVSIGVLLVLAGPIGIDAVAIGSAVGSATAAVITAGRLVAGGWRPRVVRTLARRETRSAARFVVTGGVGYLIAQVTYVVTVGFAAGLGEGSVTVYSYAFFAAGLVIGASAGPISMVLAAPLSRTWDRDPVSLRPQLLDTARANLLLVVPVVGAAAIVGRPVVELVLGSALDSDEVRVLVAVFLAHTGVLVSAALAPVPTLAAFALGRYTAVVVAAGVAGLAHLALTAAAATTDELAVLGGATSTSALLSLSFLLAIVYGRRGALRAAATLLGEVVVLAAAGAAAFAPAVALALAAHGDVVDALAAALGIVCFIGLVGVALPAHRELALRVLRARRSTATPAA